MILSDNSIKKMLKKGLLKINPLNKKKGIQCSSYDFTLGNSFKVISKNQPNKYLSMDIPVEYDTYYVKDGSYFTLPPKTFALGTTREFFELPDNLTAFVEGRSSVGRFGVCIEDAGWVDAGFKGQITLELFNFTEHPVRLIVGERIGQLVFAKLDKKAKNPYNGKYQNQEGATETKLYMDNDL